MRPPLLRSILYPHQAESPDKITVILAIGVCLILALSPLFSKVASFGAAVISLWAIVSFFSRYWSSKRTLVFPSNAIRLLFAGFLLYSMTSISGMVHNSNLEAAGWRFDSYYPFFLTGVILMLFSFHKIQLQLSANIAISSVVFASSLMFVLSFYQLQLQGLERAGVFTGYNPNIFAYLAGLYWLVILAYFCSVSDQRLKLPMAVLLCAGIYTLLAAGSRGAIVASIFSALSVLLIAFLKYRTAGGVQKKVISMTLAVVVILLAVFSQSDYFGKRFASASQQVEQFATGEVRHNAVSARLALWQGGYKIWKEQPIFGTGIGDGQHDLNQLIDQGEVPLATASYAIFHNIYVDVLATTGLFGFMVMLIGIFLLPGIYFYKTLVDGTTQDQLFAGFAGLGLLIFNAVFGLFNSWLFLRNLPVTLVLLLLLISMSNRFTGQQ